MKRPPVKAHRPTDPPTFPFGGPAYHSRRDAGFTLLELVLATFIATLVMGILAVALSFSLRVWEREQTRKPLNAPAMLELLKWQLIEFDPVPVRIEGRSGPLFVGDAHSLLIATVHSVKAISRGAPVIARYFYVPERHRLYYAEIPFNPYNVKQVDEFMQLRPSDDPKAVPRFYWTEVSSFELGFTGGGDKDVPGESWDESNVAPKNVIIKWVTPDGADTYISTVMPNSLFPIKTDPNSTSGVLQQDSAVLDGQ